MFTKPTTSTTQQVVQFLSNFVPSSQTVKKATLATITTVALGALYGVAAVSTYQYLSNLSTDGQENGMLLNVTNVIGQNATDASASWYKSSIATHTYVSGGTAGLIYGAKPALGMLGTLAGWGLTGGAAVLRFAHIIRPVST